MSQPENERQHGAFRHVLRGVLRGLVVAGFAAVGWLLGGGTAHAASASATPPVPHGDGTPAQPAATAGRAPGDNALVAHVISHLVAPEATDTAPVAHSMVSAVRPVLGVAAGLVPDAARADDGSTAGPRCGAHLAGTGTRRTALRAAGLPAGGDATRSGGLFPRSGAVTALRSDRPFSVAGASADAAEVGPTAANRAAADFDSVTHDLLAGVGMVVRSLQPVRAAIAPLSLANPVLDLLAAATQRVTGALDEVTWTPGGDLLARLLPWPATGNPAPAAGGPLAGTVPSAGPRLSAAPAHRPSGDGGVPPRRVTGWTSGTSTQVPVPAPEAPSPAPFDGGVTSGTTTTGSGSGQAGGLTAVVPASVVRDRATSSVSPATTRVGVLAACAQDPTVSPD